MVNWLLQSFMAFWGVWAFAVLFRAPMRQTWLCGVLGAVVWLEYLLLTLRCGLQTVIATALTIFCLVVVSRALAVFFKVPATLYVLSGIFTLVPGAGIYYTAYYLCFNDLAEAGVRGIDTVKTAFAIAVGILLANLIPQKWYRPVGLLREKLQRH